MPSYKDYFQDVENQRQLLEKRKKEKEQRTRSLAEQQKQSVRLNKNRAVYETIERYDSEVRKILVAYYKVHFVNCHDSAEISLTTNFDEENRITEVSWNLPYCSSGIHYARVSIHLKFRKTVFTKVRVQGFQINGTDSDIQTSLSIREVSQAIAITRPKWIEDLLRDGG